MTIEDCSALLGYILGAAVPPALLINLTAWGANCLLSAITGRGLRLNGKL